MKKNFSNKNMFSGICMMSCFVCLKKPQSIYEKLRLLYRGVKTPLFSIYRS